MRLWSHGAASKIAATAAALAVTGAFGVGAYALTQDGNAFDPTGFASAYDKGAQDSQKGYKATTESTDSAANRHDDNASSSEKSAEKKAQQDAFSELPNNGKGTTGVSVNPNAKPGTSVAVDDPSSGDGNGGGNPTGPVIDDNGNGGNGDNNGGGSGSDNPGGGSGDNNGGTTKPDTPGGNGSGSGSGGSTGSGDSSGNQQPGGDEEESDIDGTGTGPDDVVEIVPDVKEPGSAFFGGGPALSADKFTGNADDIFFATVEPKGSFDDPNSVLYAGQLIDAWTVFCSLNASFTGRDFNTYSWSCTKDEFNSPDMSKKLFYIDDECEDNSGNKINLSKGDAIPSKATQITVRYHYRYNSSCDWLEDTVDIPVVSARVYVLGLKKDIGGSATVPTLKTINTNTNGRLNPSLYSLEILEDIMGKGKNELNNGDSINHLIVDWLLNGKTAGEQFDIEPGLNTISARTVKKLDTDRYAARIRSYSVDENDNVDPQGQSVYWQTLTNVTDSESTGAEVSVPNGIQCVNIGLIEGATYPHDESIKLATSKLVLPKTVKYVDVEHNTLFVNDAFEVDSSNSKLMSLNGILATRDKDNTAYMGIPLNTSKLEVPSSVRKISFSPSNHFENGLVFDADSYDELPSANYDVLTNSTLYFKNSNTLLDFLDANPKVASSSQNNKLIISGTGQQVSGSYGLLSFDGLLLDASNSEMTIANLRNLKIAKDSLSNSKFETVIVDPSQTEFEDGSFDGAENLTTVVCLPEQRAAVVKCLGSNSTVTVVTSNVTSEGYRYYKEKTDGTVLIEAPKDCDAKFSGVIGDGISVNKIAPFAFQSNNSLHWVDIDSSVSFYGTAAFAECGSLEGVLVGSSKSKETITFEADVFNDCTSMRFFASNAENVSMKDNSVKLNSDCVLFAPTHYSGYADIGFTSFNEASNITDFKCIDAGSSLVLYGASDDEAWLCLRASSELPAQVSLPGSTVEIYNNAFTGSKCSTDPAGFHVNFNELGSLYYIDKYAFANSDLCGDVELTRSDNALSAMGDSAFANSKITSFASRANYLVINQSVFVDCKQLKTTSLSCSRYNVKDGIASNAWFGCDNLESITFDSESSAPRLTTHEPGMSFAFTDSEMDANLKVNVPESAKKSYLRSWLYSFAGAASYDELYENIYIEHVWDTPSTEEVVAWTNESILATENKLRTMLGMETVDTPTFDHREVVDGVIFKIDESGQASVVEVEDGLESVDFTKIDTSRWTEVSLQQGAFSNAASKLDVVLSDKVKVIRSGAFDGCDEVTVTLADNMPLLYDGSPSKEFDFGAKKLKLIASDEISMKCLQEWPRQMLGINNMDDYAFDIMVTLPGSTESGPTKSEISNAVNAKLREQENRVREWFGMEALKDNEAPTWAYSSPYGADDREANAQTGKNNTVNTGDSGSGNEGEDATKTPKADDDGDAGNGESGSGETEASTPSSSESSASEETPVESEEDAAE